MPCAKFAIMYALRLFSILLFACFWEWVVSHCSTIVDNPIIN